MSAPNFRREPIRSKSIRGAARGQRCTLNLPGICTHDAETVVFAHIRDETFGKGQKADDTSGCFACAACHAAYDLHTHGLPDAEILRLVLRAYQRTIRRLVIMGEMQIKHDAPMKHAVPIKPRKPPAERTKIQSRTDWPQGRKLQSRPFPQKEKA